MKNLLVLLFILVSRFFSPFLLYIHPAIACIVVYFFDSIDGYVLFSLKWKWQQYNIFDKLFDYWWYIHIAYYGFFTPMRWLIIALFIYRTMGQLFSLIGKTKYLLFFPNVLERFFWIYVLTVYVPQLEMLIQFPYIILTLLLASTFALFFEYLLHIKKSYMANYLFGLHLDWEKNKKRR